MFFPADLDNSRQLVCTAVGCNISLGFSCFENPKGFYVQDLFFLARGRVNTGFSR